MTQCNTLNVKLSHLLLNKFKSGIKNGTEVNLKIFSNVVGNSNDEHNFLHKFITNTQVLKLRKGFANGLLANIKLLKTQFLKIEQSGGFLVKLLRPLLKTGFPLKG